MNSRTKIFLAAATPAFCLLLGTFWALGSQVDASAVEQLRAAERQNQKETELERARDRVETLRILSMVADNSPLRSALQTIGANENDFQARTQIESQITDIAASRGFDLVEIGAPNGLPLSAVRKGEHGIEPIPVADVPHGEGFFTAGGVIYKLSSGPVDQDQQNVGHISIGEPLDLARYRSPVVLVHQGKIVASSDKQLTSPEVEAALASCSGNKECDVKTGNATYFSMVLETTPSGDSIRSLKNLDAAGDPIAGALRTVFLPAMLAAVAIGALLGHVGTRSQQKPVPPAAESPIAELEHS